MISKDNEVMVSIIMVSWNCASYIRRCIESIYRFSMELSFEIIVVDNGSTDRTVEIIQQHFPNVKIIKTYLNLGFPRANNIGLNHSRGRFLFLLNPDTCLESDVLGELVRFLEIHPKAGAVSPKIIDSDGSINLFSVREYPSVGNALLIQFGLSKMFPESSFFSRCYLGGWDRQSIRSVPCLTGAALMIPKSVLYKVGLLDEQLPMYFEDLDYCARILATGKLLYYIPSAILVHLGGKSAELSPNRSLLYALENGHAPWLYIRKYYGSVNSVFFTLIIFLGNTFRILILTVLSIFNIIIRSNNKKYIRQNVKKSVALIKWSLSSKIKFPILLFGIFPKNTETNIHKNIRSEMGFQSHGLGDEIIDREKG